MAAVVHIWIYKIGSCFQIRVLMQVLTGEHSTANLIFQNLLCFMFQFLHKQYLCVSVMCLRLFFVVPAALFHCCINFTIKRNCESLLFWLALFCVSSVWLSSKYFVSHMSFEDFVFKTELNNTKYHYCCSALTNYVNVALDRQ